MSNRRRPGRDNTYRTRYLHSPAWFARRDRWFAEEQTPHGHRSAARSASAPAAPRTLELHHLDYRGVTQTPHGWTAHEQHEDLTALHPRCHEYVHQLIERDRALSGFVSRRTASVQAIARLRAKIARYIEASLSGSEPTTPHSRTSSTPSPRNGTSQLPRQSPGMLGIPSSTGAPSKTATHRRSGRTCANG